MDFLVDNYDLLSAVPVEVKSGKNPSSHSALDKFLKNPDYHIQNAIVLSNDREVRFAGKITYFPIYYVMFLAPSTPLNVML